MDYIEFSATEGSGGLYHAAESAAHMATGKAIRLNTPEHHHEAAMSHMHAQGLAHVEGRHESAASHASMADRHLRQHAALKTGTAGTSLLPAAI